LATRIERLWFASLVATELIVKTWEKHRCVRVSCSFACALRRSFLGGSCVTGHVKSQQQSPHEHPCLGNRRCVDMRFNCAVLIGEVCLVELKRVPYAAKQNKNKSGVFGTHIIPW
jgi:hypothetical protein